MNFCDVCGYPTTAAEGTGYTAEEFRRIVFSWGYGPDERMINAQVAMGISRQEAISQWKNVLVAGSSTGWLLCPECAARVSGIMRKPAGSGMEGLGATETMNSVIAAAASQAAQQNLFQQPDSAYIEDIQNRLNYKPQSRLSIFHRVVRYLMIIVSLSCYVCFLLPGEIAASIIMLLFILSAILTGIYAYRFNRDIIGWTLGGFCVPFLTPFILIYITRNDV